VPNNSILDAHYPAAVFANYETACRVGDVVFGALFAASPSRMFAASVTTGGFHIHAVRNGRRSSEMILQPGGYGAHVDQDGLSGGNTPLSMAACTSIEVLEHRSPIRFVQYGLRPDSAGAGRFRGGFGTITEVEVLDGGVTAGFYIDRGIHAPWGVSGGTAALGSRVTITRCGAVPEVFSSMPKGVAIELAAGDRVGLESCGGGGYGDPLDRARESVAADIESGLISPELAAAVYGWR
jgi:N-methylhydantoinase B